MDTYTHTHTRAHVRTCVRACMHACIHACHNTIQGGTKPVLQLPPFCFLAPHSVSYATNWPWAQCSDSNFPHGFTAPVLQEAGREPKAKVSIKRRENTDESHPQSAISVTLTCWRHRKFTGLLFAVICSQQLETDLKIEKEWRQTLQNDLERERDSVSQLSAQALQIGGLKQVCASAVWDILTFTRHFITMLTNQFIINVLALNSV